MKGKNMSLALLILLTVVVMATGCGSRAKEAEEGGVKHALLVEEVKPEPVFETDVFEKADELTIEKVERTIIEGEEGEFETTYDTYVVSDITVSKGTDKTDDYAKAMADGDFNEDLIESVDFADAFGISYAGKNGKEILEALLETNGFGTDYSDLEFDEETYELTGQNTYLLKDCDVLNALSDTDADKVLKKEAYVQVTKDSSGNTMPEVFSAQVQFEKDGKTITKSLYLQVTVNAYESGEEG